MERRSVAGAIRSGSLGGILRPHVIGLAENLPGPSWLAFLLTSGVARLSGEDAAIHGPSLVWRPWKPEARATFEAGTEGIHVTLGPTALASAVGHMPVSQDLLKTARRTLSVPLDRNSELFRSLSMAFASVNREVFSRHPTARAMTDAYLRIILVEVCRLAQEQTDTADRVSPSHRVFSEFGTLVESHFRERWTVNDYARTLGLSRDRLGDICRRIRGYGPKEVIDRRVALEARLLLEGSSSSIQQVAALLGFSSTAQFSHFFARVVGSPPGTYRTVYLESASVGVSEQRQNFDWP